MTGAPFGSGFIVTLFPGIRAPRSYKAAISNGKLKQHIIQHGPKGHLYPVL